MANRWHQRSRLERAFGVARAGRTLVGLLLTGLLLAGCGGSFREATSAAPGTTTFRIHNQVRAPNELTRLIVTVDDSVLPLTIVPPYAHKPAPLSTLRLSPGLHTLAVRAVAHGECETSLISATQQPFVVAEGPAFIEIAVHDPLGVEPMPRLGVDVRVRGGRLGEALGAPSPSIAERCAPKPPVAAALCRAAAELAEAQQQGDPLRIVCVRERLSEMRTLGLIAEGGQTEPAKLSEARVLAIEGELKRCSSKEATSSTETTTVLRTGTAPRL